MSSAPRNPFGVSRHGQPIQSVSLRGGVDTGIAYSQLYAETDAAIAAGATLDELQKWYEGKYPKWFRALVLVWHTSNILISQHKEDAVAQASKKKSGK